MTTWWLQLLIVGAVSWFVIGFGVGWAARSFQFALDRECADPSHTINLDEPHRPR